MRGASGIGEKAVFVATCGDVTEQKTSDKFGKCMF